MATGELGNNKRVYGLRKFSDLQKIVDSLQKSITGILEGNINFLFYILHFTMYCGNEQYVWRRL